MSAPTGPGNAGQQASRADTVAGLTSRLTAQLRKAADSVPGDWDGFSVVAEITALGVRVTGFRYFQDRPGLPMLMDTDVIETVAALRQASPGGNGELFDVFVARLERTGGELAGNAFSVAGGARYRVTAAHVAEIAELVRPGTPLGVGATAQGESDDALRSLGVSIRSWRELQDGSVYYAAVATFGADGTHSLGFRYAADGTATPSFVGGSFLSDLGAVRAARPGADGSPAAACLLRMAIAAEVPELRFIYDPAGAAQLSWAGADPQVADRLRPSDLPRAGVVQPPAATTLDAPQLLARVENDVAASLRADDGWQRYALVVDVARRRAVSSFYAADGTPRSAPPTISPLEDLAELHRRTAADDPSWQGILALAWSGTDRLDVRLLEKAEVEQLLSDGPGPAAERIRPPEQPPSDAPPRPEWRPRRPPSAAPTVPAAPTEARDAALRGVIAAITAAPDLAVLDWDRFSLVIDATGARPVATGIRYFGYAPGQPTRFPDLGPVDAFRATSAREDGTDWRVCVVRGMRSTRQINTEFFYGTDADTYLGSAERIYQHAEQLRPS